MHPLVVLGLVAALAGRAVADGDPAVAKRLFSEGRVLYDQGKFLEACVLFEKSFQLDPAVGTKLNLAECAERENKPRTAWLLWIAAADEFERASDKRAKFARSRADALAPKLATVIVRMSKPDQAGLTVRIGDRDVSPAREIVERLEPGDVAVVARAPNRDVFETTVSAERGGKVVVEVPALPRVAGSEPEAPTTVTHARDPWKLAAITSGVLTTLAAGAYVYTALQIRRVEGEIDDQVAPFDFARINALNAEGFTWQHRARIMLGVTAGTAVVTALLIVKARSARPTRTALVTPVLAARVAGAQLELRW